MKKKIALGYCLAGALFWTYAAIQELWNLANKEYPYKVEFTRPGAVTALLVFACSAFMGIVAAIYLWEKEE